MKVGLYNLEPKIENTAMMQVSTHHKSKGDQVEIYNPLFKYDKVYAFSIFNFTDKGYTTKEMIKGGTGFDINSKLPKEIEECELDYSLYPKSITSYIWFSRGCVRRCPFCVVPKKEGNIKLVKPKKLNPKGKNISIMDNNFFANPEWRKAIKQLKIWNQRINFQSGLDIRGLTEEQIRELKELKLAKQIHIAWDNPKEDVVKDIKRLIKYIKPYRIMCYVLIGYWSTPEEDLYRVETLRDLKIDPFVMPYNKKDRYQRDFARWVNFKAIFKSVEWKDYKKAS